MKKGRRAKLVYKWSSKGYLYLLYDIAELRGILAKLTERKE